MALTFAQYVLQPFFPNCSTPDNGIRLIAAVTICEHYSVRYSFRMYLLAPSNDRIFEILIGLLTFVNCYDVKETTKMQNIFMFAKIAALVIIIIAGISWLCMGEFRIEKLTLIERLNVYFTSVRIVRQDIRKTLRTLLKIRIRILEKLQWPFILAYFHILDGTI